MGMMETERQPAPDVLASQGFQLRLAVRLPASPLLFADGRTVEPRFPSNFNPFTYP